MRSDQPFIVKRLAPMIGRPDSPRRVTVQGGAYGMGEALELAREPARRRLALEGMRAREEGGGHPWITTKIRELERTATWIERRGQPSTLARKIRGGGGGMA